MIKKKIKVTIVIGISALLFLVIGVQRVSATASSRAGSSSWVTYSVSKPYCKRVPYQGTTKPFTYQDYYQKKTNVSNSGQVTYSYRTLSKNLGGGCK